MLPIRGVVLIALSSFAAGGLLSYAWMNADAPRAAQSLRAGKGAHQFIDPLLLCSTGEEGHLPDSSSLHRELASVTDAAKKRGTISKAGVYYRDLNTGLWTGINDETKFTPASLLKVPILMAYLKMAESRPEILKRTIWYTRYPGEAPALIADPLLETEHSYSVEELLKAMIVDSDNAALRILENMVDKETLKEVFVELGMQSPYEKGASSDISPRSYSRFFRVLYNATAFSRDSSEKALSILAGSKFYKGLRAGIKDDIKVAHKYGYAIIKALPPRIIDLSDCGIVYDEKPYALCVMARGSDPEEVASYIKDVASTVEKTRE